MIVKKGEHDKPLIMIKNSFIFRGTQLDAADCCCLMVFGKIYYLFGIDLRVFNEFSH